MQSLAASSVEGILVSLSAVLMLLLAFACLGSKLFSRYVAYYGCQSIVLSFACAVVAYHYDSPELWVLAVVTFVVKGLIIPLATRNLLLRRLDLKRDVALSTGLSTSLLIGALLTALAYSSIRPEDLPHGLIASS
ncbi:MAG: hypothetical protein ACLPKZ_05470, partial [Acidimicrobiales bacterium]